MPTLTPPVLGSIGPAAARPTPSYDHVVAKSDVPRVPPQDIVRTSIQMVLVVERLLAETGHPVRSRH